MKKLEKVRLPEAGAHHDSGLPTALDPITVDPLQLLGVADLHLDRGKGMGPKLAKVSEKQHPNSCQQIPFILQSSNKWQTGK